MKLLPIIDHQTLSLSMQSVKLLVEEGVHEVLFLSFAGNDESVVNAARRVKEAFPALGVGINLIVGGMQASTDLSSLFGLDLIWVEHSGIYERSISPAGHSLIAFKRDNPDIEVLCSLGHHGHRYGEDVALSALTMTCNGLTPVITAMSAQSSIVEAHFQAVDEASWKAAAIYTDAEPNEVDHVVHHGNRLMICDGLVAPGTKGLIDRSRLQKYLFSLAR